MRFTVRLKTDRIRGTGFVAHYHDSLWVVTAGHIGLGGGDRDQGGVHDRWMEWSQSIQIEGTDVSLPLFDADGQPSFAHAAHEGKVGDVIAIRLPSGSQRVTPACMEITGTSPHEGEACCVLGYPGGQTDVVEQNVVAQDVEEARFRFSPLAREGFSGGPIVSISTMQLRGVCIGYDPSDRIGDAASVSAVAAIISRAPSNRMR